MDVEDRLEPLGVAVGLFLVVGGLASLAGMPWATSGGPLVTVLQLAGIALGTALGVGLTWLSYGGEGLT